MVNKNIAKYSCAIRGCTNNATVQVYLSDSFVRVCNDHLDKGIVYKDGNDRRTK